MTTSLSSLDEFVQERLNNWLLRGCPLAHIQYWLAEDYAVKPTYCDLAQRREHILTQALKIFDIPKLPIPKTTQSTPTPAAPPTDLPSPTGKERPPECPDGDERTSLSSGRGIEGEGERRLPSNTTLPASNSPPDYRPQTSDLGPQSPVLFAQFLAYCMQQLAHKNGKILTDILKIAAQFRSQVMTQRKQDFTVYKTEEAKAKDLRDKQRREDFNRPFTTEEARAIIKKVESITGPFPPSSPYYVGTPPLYPPPSTTAV